MNEMITRNHGNSEFEVIFKTNDKDNYEYVQSACRDCIDDSKQIRFTSSNPLDPARLEYALSCEMLKYNYRKRFKPKEISIVDQTVIKALQHCIEENRVYKEN